MRRTNVRDTIPATITNTKPDVIVITVQTTKTSVEMALAQNHKLGKSFQYSYVYGEMTYKNARIRRNPKIAGVATTTFESQKS